MTTPLTGSATAPLTVYDIVRAHLLRVGAAGLAGNDCGCGLADLMPCGGSLVCASARKIECAQCPLTAEERESLCPGDDAGHCYQAVDRPAFRPRR